MPAATPAQPKRWSWLKIIFLVVSGIIGAMCLLSIILNVILYGVLGPAAVSKVDDLNLEKICNMAQQPQGPVTKATEDKCQDWLNGIKQDHRADYDDCSTKTNRYPAYLYECLVDRGLGPK